MHIFYYNSRNHLLFYNNRTRCKCCCGGNIIMNLNVLKDSSEIVNYNNPMIPIYVSKCDLDFFPNREALVHWHEDVEFLMPIKGHITYQINGKTFSIGEGEAIFVNSRQMHYGFSSDHSNCEYICITFNPRSLFTLSSIQHQYVDPILDCNQTQLIITNENEAGRSILASIQQLDQIYLQKVDIEIKAMGCLYRLWESLFFLMKPFFVQEISKYDANLPTLKKMLLYIYQNFEIGRASCRERV